MLIKYNNSSMSNFTNDFYSFISENKDYTEAHFVYQNIFLGSLEAANDYKWLKENGITHILGMIGYQHKYSDIEYLVYSDIDDDPTQNLIKYFSPTFEFIDRSFKTGGRVLVHCHAGISRSSTIVIAYLMYKYGMDFSKAFDITKKARSIVHPNYGFILQLNVLNDIKPEERKIFISNKL